MRIPEEKIEEVRTANDVVEVIGAHVQLKKRGKNYVGLCPFHQEKTPSFTVSADKQMYHCFGCALGGNVFTFVMEFEKVSFVEAVRTLAARAGIALPESEAEVERSGEVEQLYNACRFAGLFFHTNLTKTDEGRTALEYFRSRGFLDDTIRTFGLGYSMQSWDALLARAKDEGISPEHLLKAGLLRQREDGTLYDYFRGRAMFPIFSPAGRVIGFGARKLRNDDPVQGKYINSPETPIYYKSRVLYGLFQAKEAIRSENNALMVEGYTDLLSLVQAGFQNVVATSGTALTEDQLYLLGRYAKNLALVFDADIAGSQATVRGVGLALEQDFDVKVVELPQGDDPDSFLQREGAKAFRATVESAVSFIDYLAQQFQRAGALSTPEGQAEAVRQIVSAIARMKDELKRNFYLKHVAERYGMYESVLFRELERAIGKDRQASRVAASSARRVPVYQSDMADVTPARTAPISAPERDILKLMLEGPPEVVQLLASHISTDELENPNVQTLVSTILGLMNESGPVNLSAYVESLTDPELKSIVTDLALSRYELSRGWSAMNVEIDEPDPREIARKAIVAVKRRVIQKEVERNQRELKEASQRGQEVKPFVLRHKELLNQLRSIEAPSFFPADSGTQ